MTGFDDSTWLDGLGLAELVRKKEVTPLELVDAAIGRIEKLNPELNAVITPLFEQARDAAKAGPPDGPFGGVPFLMKDLGAHLAGTRMTLGSKSMLGFVSDHDSELTRRLKRSGLIILGKTNTPEFGLLPTTEPEYFGPTRNPWDPGRTPGGSSGGSAAAVASGMVPMGHGNDGGGSIRIPASCCGIFGLKPTRARNPLGPDFGDLIGGLAVEHGLTRSVRDSAALLDATSGPDLGDPYWAPPPARPFLEEVGADPGRLKIAMTTTPARNLKVQPDAVKAVEDAAALLTDLGHEVVEAAPRLNGDKLAAAFTALWASNVAGTMSAISSEPSRDQFEILSLALYEMGQKITGPQFLQAVTYIQRVSRTVAGFMVDYDLMLTPTLSEPPTPLGTFDPSDDNPHRGMGRSGVFAAFTPLANATGQPGMSVPLYWNEDNLPIGVQFLGRFGDEATLFRLAAQLESARPWNTRRPPVSA